MKKTIVLALCVLLIFGGLLQASAEQPPDKAMPFTDVPASSWYCASVSYAYFAGLTAGVSQSQFAPQRPVTRAEFLTMLGRLLMEDYAPYEEDAPTLPAFEDVKNNCYYTPYVTWGVFYGVIAGTSETTFSPDAPILRQDMATMIYRAEQIATVPEIPIIKEENAFIDDAEISGYARPAIYLLQQQGLLCGDGKGNVSPKANLTRAEAITVITRLHMILHNHTHNYQKVKETAATCSSAAFSTFSCSCGSFYAVKTSAALGHNFQLKSSTAPTCTACGTELWICSRCGKEQIKTTQDPLGHDYKLNATDITFRRYEFKCSRCGDLYYEAMPTLTPQRIYSGDKLLYYSEMCNYLDRFAALYPGLVTVSSAGASVKGVNIPVVTLGYGQRYIFLNGNIHAREYITTNYLLEVIDEYAYAYATNGSVGGYRIKPLLDAFTLVIIPCSNPDGRAIALAGNAQYKANGRGVDLNGNFPTNWVYASSGYYGQYAGSEPETQAIMGVMDQYSFELVLDCHTAGNVIYYADDQCSQALLNRSKAIAKALSAESGYGLYTYRANAGMANYARHPYGCPGFTVEMWPTLEHPIDCSGFYTKIWNKLSTMPAIAMNYLK